MKMFLSIHLCIYVYYSMQSFTSHPEIGNMDAELSEDVFKPRRNLLVGKQ